MPLHSAIRLVAILRAESKVSEKLPLVMLSITYSSKRKAGPTRGFLVIPQERFALPNPMSHVSSAALTQAQLRPGSSSPQVLVDI